MNDTLWDVFISHASEDKDTVARPLASALKKAGMRVWLDEHELKLGDSLSGKIDHGLASSAFGVVIMSPTFFSKRWPKAELAGLRAIQEDGQKRILPVWHQIDKATVAKNSPVIADLLAASTSEGIEKVAQAIIDEVFRPGSTNPSSTARLIDLLHSKPARLEFVAFLHAHWKCVAHLMHCRIAPLWDAKMAAMHFDAVALANLGTTRVPTLQCVLFLPIWDSPFAQGDSKTKARTVLPTPLLREAIADAHRVIATFERNALGSDFKKIIRRLRKIAKEDDSYEPWEGDDIPPLIDITIFCGRRAYVDASKATALAWRDYRIEDGRLRLRTYDGLIDAFQQAECGLGWDFDF